MSGSTDFKVWAEAAHRESLRAIKPKSERRRGHWPCPDCPGTDFKRHGLLLAHRSKKHQVLR